MRIANPTSTRSLRAEAKRLRVAENKLKKDRELLQKRCSHPEIQCSADSGDFAFNCALCGKPWLNEVPRIVRTFRYGDGLLYRTDGKGGVELRTHH